MKKYKYDTVVFDMDGTVLDTVEDLKDATNYALRKSGFKERTSEEMKSFLGNGMKVMLEKAAPSDITDEERKKLTEDFTEYYLAHSNDKTKAYDGILEVMKTLKEAGIKMAIVSNKPDMAVTDLDKLYFKGLTTLAVGERPGIVRKPAPDMVETALKEMGMSKEGAVYIGDTEVDLLTAKNTGIPCITALWGFRSKEYLLECGATMLAKTPADILNFF